MPSSSVRMANNTTQYDYLIYGHVPSKPFKPKIVTAQQDQLRKNQRRKRNVK